MRHTIEAALATIVVPGAAVLGIPWLILRATGSTPPGDVGVLGYAAIVVALAGAAMIIWVSIAFVRRGRGTPVPIDPPTIFVADGLFRVVRNPMYLGALLVLGAEIVVFRSLPLLAYAALLWLALHTFLIAVEEPQLKRRFGESYVAYLATTPRWIPRMSRRT